jgi:ELWxxDGT repeat protein
MVGEVPGIGIASLGDRLVFAGRDAEHGTELWTTDGTPGGTRLVADIR